MSPHRSRPGKGRLPVDSIQRRRKAQEELIIGTSDPIVVDLTVRVTMNGSRYQRSVNAATVAKKALRRWLVGGTRQDDMPEAARKLIEAGVVVADIQPTRWGRIRIDYDLP